MKQLIVFIFCILFVNLLSAQTLKGRAVNIADGDTFTLLQADNSTIRVRLYGIDCPEKGQDYGNVAKTFTKEFLKDKDVTVEQKDIDRYGRIIGIVYVRGVAQPLNEALLKSGLAWHYTHYDRNPAWSALEKDAKEEGRGLWQLKNAFAPWEYRKAVRARQP